MDQFGEGLIKGLPYFANEKYCQLKPKKLVNFIKYKNWANIQFIKDQSYLVKG